MRSYINQLSAPLFAITLLLCFGTAGASNSLLAHWSFDSTQGNTYYDVTGNGYNAIASGSGLALTQGVRGRALECPANGYDLVVANSRTAFFTNTFTIETWFYNNATTLPLSDHEKLFEYSNIPGSGGSPNGYNLCIEFSGRPIVQIGNGSWISCFANTVIAPHTWYHLACTYDNSTLRIYVNGVQENSLSFSGGIISTGGDVRIGCQRRMDGTERGFANGKVDEMKFYNYALSQDTIRAHYNSQKPGTGQNQLIAHWSFDASAGNTYYDVTGHGYDVVSNLGVTSGIKGNALNCNSGSYSAVVNNSTSAFDLPRFSIEAWIKCSVISNFMMIFSHQTYYGPSGSGGFETDIGPDGTVYLNMAGINGQWIGSASSTKLSAGHWYHIVGTYDGTAMKVYVNGALAGATPNASGYVQTQLPSAYIGYQASASGQARNWFNGKIDELKIYNYALSQDTVQTHYNSDNPGMGQNGLLAHWSFDSTQGNTYYDVTGNGYDAIASGSGLALTQGVRGSALECPPSGYDLVVANSRTAFFTNTFTIETWFYNNATTLPLSDHEKIFEYSNVPESGGTPNGYTFYIDFSGRPAITVGTTSWLPCYGSTVLAFHTWYHLSCTYDGSSLRIYVNGVLESSVAYSGGIIYTGGDVRIGCQRRTNGTERGFVNGRLDELKFYNYALPADSIAAHYNPAPGSSSVNFGMPTIYARPGEEVWVPVYINNKNAALKISACTFICSIDTAVLTFVEASDGYGIWNDWPMAGYAAPKNRVTITLGDTTVPQVWKSGEIVRCKFRVNRNAQTDDSSDIVFKTIILNEGMPFAASNRNGTVLVSGPVGVKKRQDLAGREISIQRTPHELVIVNSAKMPGSVCLYDIKGRQVYTTAFPATAAEVRIPTKQFSAGVYMASLRIGTRSISKPIVIK
jgi:hypothetical protein